MSNTARISAYSGAVSPQVASDLFLLLASARIPICARQSAKCQNLTPAKKLVTSARLLGIILPAGEETIAVASPYLSDVTLAPLMYAPRQSVRQLVLIAGCV